MAAAGLADDGQSGEEPSSQGLSLTGGLDCPSAYYFRGYLQADRGLILQPYLNVFVPCPLADGAVVSPYVALFNSSHFQANNPMADMTDGMLGAITTWRGVIVDVRYAYYNTSPAMRSSVHELGGKGSIDLLALGANETGAFSLRPSAGLYAELSDSRGTEEVYAEAGLEPSWRGEVLGTRVGLGLPLILGMSADGYYRNRNGGNDPLGYFSAAVTTSVTLPVPAGCGRWFLNASLQYLHLFADNLAALQGCGRNVLVGKVGLGFAF